MPAPVALVFSHVVSVVEAPWNKMAGKLRSVFGPLASLYAFAINAALSSLMLANVSANLASEGRLPHRRRVVTPDWLRMPVVGKRGATNERLVGWTGGKVIDISQECSSCR